MLINIDWGKGDPEETRELREIVERMAVACCGDNAIELWAAELYDVVAQHGPIAGDFYASLIYGLSALAAGLACGGAIAILGADADHRMIYEAARKGITAASGAEDDNG